MNSEGTGQVLSRWQLLAPQQVIYQAEGEPLQAPDSRPFSWQKKHSGFQPYGGAVNLKVKP